VLGYPPKAIRLAIANCTNQRVIDALVKAREEIEATLSNVEIGLVELYGPRGRASTPFQQHRSGSSPLP